MKDPRHLVLSAAIFAIYLGLVVALPLIGVLLSGLPIDPFLHFPPLTQPQPPAEFSWFSFFVILSLVLIVIGPFLLRVVSTPSPAARPRFEGRPLPVWGWFGFSLLVVAWILAWNRFSWFASFQAFTFTPLWIGYILCINALSYRSRGRCVMLDHPGDFLLLFPLSAGFWWSFEYLNRFTNNWFYVGLDDIGAWPYFWQATFPFATVLPAVWSTYDWLRGYPRVAAGLHGFWRISQPHPRILALAALSLGALGLLGTALRPAALYPLVWIAPLMILSGLQALAGRCEPLLKPLSTGNWTRSWKFALAGLICGFLWELWNFQSLAHWEYWVPFAQGFHIFEMPLLGYAGYLPFGIMCGTAISLVRIKNRIR